MLVADPHRELTVEDVEPLVLLVVDVPRRAFALPDGHLDQPVFAAGVGAADLDDLKHPEQPVRLTLVRTEQIPMLRAFGGNHSHLTGSFLGVSMILDCPLQNSSKANYLRPNNQCQAQLLNGYAPGACTSRAHSHSLTSSMPKWSALPASRCAGTTCWSISRRRPTACA